MCHGSLTYASLSCVQHMTSIIYRALHHSVERNKKTYRQHHESQCEYSSRVALATVDRSRGSSLTSWIFAHTVLNSLNRSTQRECLPIDPYFIGHFSTISGNQTSEGQLHKISRHQIPRLHVQPLTTAFHICDISLVFHVQTGFLSN